MRSSKYARPNDTWENSNCIVVKLTIESPTPEDFGTYTCLLMYNTDIIQQMVNASGQIDYKGKKIMVMCYYVCSYILQENNTL